ncbi:hypothetical protein ACIOD2_22310 [Amycolatopsis sp. NPDC088138]|uniref:hypothetical protein n=1 Tax=Amycolatopsis sp. NPDC088138 TaxID=3363938 RepID=UPI00380FF395
MQFDAIARKAYYGVWLLGLCFAALAIWGFVRHPHWFWVTPIGAAALALIANQRIRGSGRRGETVLLGVATLVFVVVSGLLLGLALRLS